MVDIHGNVMGCGYNKMPLGCEDRLRLNWDVDKGKHHYGTRVLGVCACRGGFILRYHIKIDLPTFVLPCR